MCLTSCEGTLDDVFGEWSRPSGNNSQSNEKPSEPTMMATPLTLEAITAGTIVVKNPQAGMKYSLNGGAKQTVTTDAITVAVGDKVAFYGKGTSISCYGSTDPSNCTKIAGGTAEVKVYGNIMSLLDETGFATASTLPATEYTFYELFSGNDMLKDGPVVARQDAGGILLLTYVQWLHRPDRCTCAARRDADRELLLTDVQRLQKPDRCTCAARRDAGGILLR